MSKGHEQSVLGALQANLRLKFILAIVLNVLFMGPYYLAQVLVFRPVHLMTETQLDKLIPFQPELAGLYLSLMLLMPFGPMLLSTRRELWIYSGGVLTQGFIGAFCFFVWPTLMPDQLDSSCQGCLYQYLPKLVGRMNACPSLHAAMATYSILWAHLALKKLNISAVFYFILVLWASGILYATIATRQHYAVDIVAGMVLGTTIFCVVRFVLFRQTGSAVTFTPMLQEG